MGADNNKGNDAVLVMVEGTVITCDIYTPTAWVGGFYRMFFKLPVDWF